MLRADGTCPPGAQRAVLQRRHGNDKQSLAAALSQSRPRTICCVRCCDPACAYHTNVHMHAPTLVSHPQRWWSPQPRDPGESLQGTQARRLQTTFTWCRASVPVSGGEAKSLHTGPGLPDGSDAVATDPNLPPRLPPGALPVGPCCLPCSGPGTVPLPPTPCCLPSPPSPGALPRGPVLPCMLRTVDMTLALKAA